MLVSKQTWMSVTLLTTRMYVCVRLFDSGDILGALNILGTPSFSLSLSSRLPLQSWHARNLLLPSTELGPTGTFRALLWFWSMFWCRWRRRRPSARVVEHNINGTNGTSSSPLRRRFFDSEDIRDELRGFFCTSIIVPLRLLVIVAFTSGDGNLQRDVCHEIRAVDCIEDRSQIRACFLHILEVF